MTLHTAAGCQNRLPICVRGLSLFFLHFKRCIPSNTFTITSGRLTHTLPTPLLRTVRYMDSSSFPTSRYLVKQSSLIPNGDRNHAIVFRPARRASHTLSYVQVSYLRWTSSAPAAMAASTKSSGTRPENRAPVTACSSASRTSAMREWSNEE